MKPKIVTRSHFNGYGRTAHPHSPTEGFDIKVHRPVLLICLMNGSCWDTSKRFYDLLRNSIGNRQNLTSCLSSVHYLLAPPLEPGYQLKTRILRHRALTWNTGFLFLLKGWQSSYYQPLRKLNVLHENPMNLAIL
jgi:hypothetical protein